MNVPQLLFAVVVFFCMRFAFAGEFNHDGIRIDFSSDFTERKITQLDGFTTYQLMQHYGAGSPREVIVILIHIRDISNDLAAQQRVKNKGAAYESELSLAVAVRNVFGFPEFRLLKDLRSLEMSGNKAVTATVSYSGSYADRAWTTGVANVAIYCLTQPTRAVEFQVFALSDAPTDLISSAIDAVENVQLQTP